ncbi:hypothetical protein A3N54_05680 [Klebsiella aerogenes]|nr:hypothetical protein A3N54_05680 [Klebsiella aerogenes]
MTFIKIIGVMWMLACFVIVLCAYVKNVNAEGDVFNLLFASIFVWGLIAITPIAIVKFGWEFINR